MSQCIAAATGRSALPRPQLRSVRRAGAAFPCTPPLLPAAVKIDAAARPCLRHTCRPQLCTHLAHPAPGPRRRRRVATVNNWLCKACKSKYGTEIHNMGAVVAGLGECCE